jgi:hypothetical protein
MKRQPYDEHTKRSVSGLNILIREIGLYMYYETHLSIYFNHDWANESKTTVEELKQMQNCVSSMYVRHMGL